MNDAVRDAARQDQFLDVVSREEAEARLRRHVVLAPLGVDHVALATARGRVLAEDVAAPVDVPGFDRASVDGFALRAADTIGASESAPVTLRLTADLLTPGVEPSASVGPGEASVIATGGMLPRGADAVIMVEHTDTAEGGRVAVHRAMAAGTFVAGAGSDIARGETVLRRGLVLTAREIGMLAAIGLAEIAVWRRPLVAILSTGDEIVPPGSPIRPGQVYDSNAAILAASVEECGGVPLSLGIVRDDRDALARALDRAMAEADVVLLSGGTSKGAGDLAYGVVRRLARPGVIVHGVALKPGKPLCLAVQDGKPVAVLPGFPTSAIFTFHGFLAPVIRALAGLPEARAATVEATLPLRASSERGRTEYVMVSLMEGADGLLAYPTAKGSGAVTGFAAADGFFEVPAMAETVPAGTAVAVTLIGARAAAPDLVVIGSQCAGLDLLLGLLDAEGLRAKSLAVGSSAGLAAASRGECDLAGIHLMDPATGEYNRPLLPQGVDLVRGYGRLQGMVVRPDDARFANCTSPEDIVAAADAETLMVNRNAGSGTRVLIDRLLGGARPPGYASQTKSHNAVAVAVAGGRADWGVAIETVARDYGLRFLPLQPEQFDFAIPTSRLQREPVQRFIAVLARASTRAALRAKGFEA